MDRSSRRRLLQSHQSHVRRHIRTLHEAIVSGDVGRGQVRVLVVRQRAVQEADPFVGARIHWPAHGLDREADKRREHISCHRWRAVSQKFSIRLQEAAQSPIPRVRSRLHPSFRSDYADWRRSAREHLLQAFHLLCRRVQFNKEGGDRAAHSNDISNVSRSDREAEQKVLNS